MTTLTLYGYSYGAEAPMNLQLSFYIYHTNEGVPYFYLPVISSAGAYTPQIQLANEDGKVCVYINDRVYYQHFYVNAFSGFIKPEYYQSWTIVDEAFTGNSIMEAVYKNAFKGDIAFPGGRWAGDGNVGIGTAAPQAKLSVNGNILATEIKIKTDISVPDYVFEPDYKLSSLADIAGYVKEHKHLPEIPSASDIATDGLDLAKMNLALLKKIEELTIHLIELDKKVAEQASEIKQLKYGNL